MRNAPHHPTRRLTLGLAGAALVAGAFPAGGVLAETPSTPAWDDTLEDLQRRTFNYFWRSADPDSGFSPDAWPKPIFSSIAAIGFCLSAYCIGVKRGYAERKAAATRARAVLERLWAGPQGEAVRDEMGAHGFFYHFLDLKTGLRFRDVELSTIDTAMLVLGCLTAAAFFDGDSEDEHRIRTLGLGLYNRLDWKFVTRKSGLVSMGWRPQDVRGGVARTGLIPRDWDRYNEGMMVLLLALGREDEVVNPEAWANWSATLAPTFGPNFGEPHLGFSPLFGHQYSHCWFDFRGLADPFMRAKGLTYFENSRRATLAQRNYAIQNPGGFASYGADVWGLTACQGPGDFSGAVGGRTVRFHGYSARGPQTGDGESIDDGTLAPTAGVSSIAFAPEVVIPLIHSLRRRFGDDIYGEFGFLDAFNPSTPRNAPIEAGRMTERAGWVSDQYLGIDQGPILMMLENYRSGFVWDLFRTSPVTAPIARRAFQRAGFRSVAPEGRWIDSV